MAYSVGAKGILVPEPGDQYNVQKWMESSDDAPDHITDTFANAVEWIIRRLDCLAD